MYFTQFSRGECYHSSFADLVVEDENTRKAAWTVPASKRRVTRWTTSRGAFQSIKNSGLNFLKFSVTNETAFSGNFGQEDNLAR